jgi:putative acetyltransferase
MGTPITIRRVSVKDAAALAQLMSDPEVYGGTLQLPYPNEEMWQARLAGNAVIGKPDVSLAAERDGEIVGWAGLNTVGLSPRRRHAMGLGISVARGAQAQGVGTVLMAALCDYADRWLGTLRIELTVYADNEIAQRLYRKFGFEVEGRYRFPALRDGVYVDSSSMARFHPNPPVIDKAPVVG